MRKLGILLIAIGAATVGMGGTAAAQQAELCDQVVGGIAGATADSPVDDTTAGLQQSCNESFEKPGVVADPVLCGLEADVTELAEPLGEAVGGVHGTLDDIEGQAEAGGLPDIVDFDHPCDAGSQGGGGTALQSATTTGGDGALTEVQSINAAADGGLPRTGGELFAGASLGLLSLGTLIRRFLP